MTSSSIQGARTLRTQLQRKLWDSASSQRSGGDSKDPVTRAVGWGTDRIYKFESGIEAYPQSTLGQMREAALTDLGQDSRTTRRWGVGALSAIGLAGIGMLAAPALGAAVGIAVAGAGLAMATISTGAMLSSYMQGEQTRSVVNGIETWGAAFSAAEEPGWMLSDSPNPCADGRMLTICDRLG